jgi:hypothetical protein
MASHQDFTPVPVPHWLQNRYGEIPIEAVSTNE